MRILSEIKYPKLSLLILSFIVAYLLFSNRFFTPLHNILILLGYFGTFLAGIFYAYGFTAATATAMLLIFAKEQNFLLAGLIAGIGALLSDLIIFLFIRHTFAEEIKRLSRGKTFQSIQEKLPSTLKKYLITVFAGFLIASPLPTEIGVTLMASMKNISTKKFAVMAYLLHTIGIFTILLIGSVI